MTGQDLLASYVDAAALIDTALVVSQEVLFGLVSAVVGINCEISLFRSTF